MGVKQAFEKNATITSMFRGGEKSYIQKLVHSGRFVIGPQKANFESATCNCFI